MNMSTPYPHSPKGSMKGGVMPLVNSGFQSAGRRKVSPYDPGRVYRTGEQVSLPYGLATSRTNRNSGNDPLTDDGSNWVLEMNGPRMTEHYGRNQTEELPTETIGSGHTVSSEGVIGFNTSADETENGGVGGIAVHDITRNSDADPNVSHTGSGITIGPSRISLIAEFYGNQTPDADLHIRMMEVASGTDDIIRLIGTQRQQNFVGTGINDVHAHYEMFRKFRVEDTTTYYFQLVNYTTNQDRVVGYFQIERLG